MRGLAWGVMSKVAIPPRPLLPTAGLVCIGTWQNSETLRDPVRLEDVQKMKAASQSFGRD